MSVKTRRFRLPAGANPDDFQIVGDLSQVSQWKARVFAGNSGDVPVGSFDGVGYVMISLRDATILPIALSDEHRNGFDVLCDYHASRIATKPEHYFAIPARGAIYRYDDGAASTKRLLKAAAKWRSYGGENLVVIGSYDAKGLIGTIDDFLAADGILSVPAGELPPLGQRIVEALKTLQASLRASRLSMSHTVTRAPITQARRLMHMLSPVACKLSLSADFYKTAQRIDTAEAAEDLGMIDDAIFGQRGIKNAIHNQLRAWERGTLREFASEDLTDIFGGDPALAAGLFSAL